MNRVIGKSEFIVLVIALFSLFTVIMPVAGFAADNDYTKYSSTYTYVTADDKVSAGTATVRYQNDFESSVSDVTYVQVKLSLPYGVEFSDTPVASDVYSDNTNYTYFAEVGGLDPLASGNYYVKSNSSSITLKGEYIDNAHWNDFVVNFTFTEKVMPLNIDSDFSGNLDVTIEVWGLANETILWSESDTVTIAKVAGSNDVLVSAKDPKIVSTGSAKKGADIKVYETKPGTLCQDYNPEYVVFDILTDGVTFNSASNIQAIRFSNNGQYDLNLDADGDKTKATFKVVNKSSIFPGDIVFTPYFDVNSQVTGDIRIRVSSARDDGNGTVGTRTSTVSRTTVVVATVTGIGARARIDQLENNDTVISSGELVDLDASFKIITEDGTTFKVSDIMTFRLNKGKFAADPEINSDKAIVRRYDNNNAFYVYFNSETIDEFTLDSFKIILDNDVEPGDITLTISGDYGDLGDVTIGIAALPMVVKSTNPSDKANNIKTNSNIQVNFNQKVQKGNDFNLIGVKDSDNNAANVIVFLEDANLIISPVDSLGYSTTYTVNIPATAIKSLTGNTLNNDVKFTFTTESNSNVSGGGGGGGGNYDPPKDSVNDVSEKVNDLLKNADRGDTITIDSDKNGPKVINYITLRKIAEKGCNFSVDSQDAKVSLTFEPEALLATDVKVGENTLIEFSASIVNEDENKDVKNYAISVGGKVLRAYNFNISVKETNGTYGKEIHNLNGNASVALDLSDMSLDEINTELLTVIHQQPDGTWVNVESTFEPETKTLRFTTDSFSVFAIIEKMKEESKIIKLIVGQTKASVDHSPFALDAKPYVDTEADRVFVPLRFISEALGAEVDWVDVTKSIVIKEDTNEIKLTIGSNDILVNGDVIAIDCAPEMLSSGRSFVPLRFISEKLGAKVGYESLTKQITIIK